MSNHDNESKDKTLHNDVMYHKVTNMALNPRQDTLLFTTDSNQILKVQINLERPYEVDKYEYLITSFHSKGIVGLDVCIKKQLIATCATDRTVRIWSYNSSNVFSLDLC
jgi:WD40 repeat protein